MGSRMPKRNQTRAADSSLANRPVDFGSTAAEGKGRDQIHRQQTADQGPVTAAPFPQNLPFSRISKVAEQIENTLETHPWRQKKMRNDSTTLLLYAFSLESQSFQAKTGNFTRKTETFLSIMTNARGMSCQLYTAGRSKILQWPEWRPLTPATAGMKNAPGFHRETGALCAVWEKNHFRWARGTKCCLGATAL